MSAERITIAGLASQDGIAFVQATDYERVRRALRDLYEMVKDMDACDVIEARGPLEDEATWDAVLCAAARELK